MSWERSAGSPDHTDGLKVHQDGPSSAAGSSWLREGTSCRGESSAPKRALKNPPWTKLPQGKPKSLSAGQAANEGPHESTNAFSHWPCLLLILSESARGKQTNKQQGKPHTAPSAPFARWGPDETILLCNRLNHASGCPYQPPIVPCSLQGWAEKGQRQAEPPYSKPYLDKEYFGCRQMNSLRGLTLTTAPATGEHRDNSRTSGF